MNLEPLKGKSPLIDSLLAIAEQYFRDDKHDDWCRSKEGNRPCHCHRGKLYTELVEAATLEEKNSSCDLYKTRAKFDIKAGEFFVINLSTAEVMLESMPKNAMLASPASPPKSDVVNHPSHYNAGKIEVIEFIEDQRLNYHLGNSVKYISRAGRKDPTKELEDLEKAAWYLKRRIETLRAEREGRTVVRPNAMNARPS